MSKQHGQRSAGPSGDDGNLRASDIKVLGDVLDPRLHSIAAEEAKKAVEEATIARARWFRPFAIATGLVMGGLAWMGLDKLSSVEDRCKVAAEARAEVAAKEAAGDEVKRSLRDLDAPKRIEEAANEVRREMLAQHAESIKLVSERVSDVATEAASIRARVLDLSAQESTLRKSIEDVTRNSDLLQKLHAEATALASNPEFADLVSRSVSARLEECTASISRLEVSVAECRQKSEAIAIEVEALRKSANRPDLKAADLTVSVQKLLAFNGDYEVFVATGNASHCFCNVADDLGLRSLSIRSRGAVLTDGREGVLVAFHIDYNDRMTLQAVQTASPKEVAASRLRVDLWQRGWTGEKAEVVQLAPGSWGHPRPWSTSPLPRVVASDPPSASK